MLVDYNVVGGPAFPGIVIRNDTQGFVRDAGPAYPVLSLQEKIVLLYDLGPVFFSLAGLFEPLLYSRDEKSFFFVRELVFFVPVDRELFQNGEGIFGIWGFEH